MKKILFIVLACWLLTGTSYATEVRPYYKLGTVDSQEASHKAATTHKVMVGMGVDITQGETFQGVYTGEIWTIAEPTDGDREVPNDGILLSGVGRYNIKLDPVTISPQAGIGFEWWRRNSPDGVGLQDFFYGDLYFLEAIAGISGEYNNKYFKVCALYPLWTRTDSGQRPQGRLGFVFNFGTMIDNVDLGMFYKQSNFTGDGTQTDFVLEQYGVLVGYRF